MRRFWTGLAIAISFAAITAGGIVITDDSGGAAPDGFANIWIESGAGACAGGRSGTPISYADSASPDRRCGDWDDAWDAMSAGDTARAVNGTYGAQLMDGDKASQTFIIGQSKAGVEVGTNSISCDSPEYDPADGTSGICIYSDNLTIRNATFDAGSDDGVGSAIRSFRVASNVRLEDVDIHGDQPTLYITGPTFTWDGGDHGEAGHVPFRTCDNTAAQPIQIEDLADNFTLKDINAYPWTTREGVGGPACGGDDTPHLEWLRVQGALDNLTLNGVTFLDGGEWGSGFIFTSGGGAGSGWKIMNSAFHCNRKLGPSNCSGQWMDNNPESPCNIVWAYNTWEEDYSGGPVSICNDSAIWVGNIAPSGAGLGCEGTHVKNVQSGSGSCGTDTFTGGAASALGIDGTTLLLEAGSPGINAAETPSSSDYCTDSAYVNSLDRSGGPRPVASICDAGSDERD